MNMDFAKEGLLVQRWRLYPVFVHRLALLLRASFGPSVAGTPLRFANPSPPSGWVEDFHFLAAGHAQHTRQARFERAFFPLWNPSPTRRKACRRQARRQNGGPTW